MISSISWGLTIAVLLKKISISIFENNLFREGQNFLAVVQKKIAQRYEKIQNHQQQTIGVLPSKELNQVLIYDKSFYNSYECRELFLNFIF